MAICDVTYTELKAKDVVNICNCKKLGRIIDMVVDLKNGCVKGIVIPGTKRLSIFRAPEDIFIPWKNILRIGNDVILIELKQKVPKECVDKDRCGVDDIPKNLFEGSQKAKQYSDEDDI